MTYNLILLLCIVVTIHGQIPIPNQPLGYTYEWGHVSARLQFSFFIGPLCIDSRDAFPTILQVADHYGPDTLRLTVHLFPLPYHRNAFLAAKGTHMVNIMMENQTYNWISNVFDNMHRLSNYATYNSTDAEVQDILTSIASSMDLNGATFSDMFSDRAIERATRLGWKYTATRGIAWAPAFMINEVLILADKRWTVQNWKRVIDRLLD